MSLTKGQILCSCFTIFLIWQTENWILDQVTSPKSHSLLVVDLDLNASLFSKVSLFTTGLHHLPRLEVLKRALLLYCPSLWLSALGFTQSSWVKVERAQALYNCCLPLPLPLVSWAPFPMGSSGRQTCPVHALPPRRSLAGAEWLWAALWLVGWMGSSSAGGRIPPGAGPTGLADSLQGGNSLHFLLQNRKCTFTISSAVKSRHLESPPAYQLQSSLPVSHRT